MLGSTNVPKIRLLAIDDDADYLAQLSKSLNIKYDVTKAHSASEAMGLLRNHEYAGILLDLYMPEVDGMQLLKVLRGLKTHIPVLMLTSNHSPSSVVKAIQDGASDYITKKAELPDAELEFRIEKMVSRQHLTNKAQLLEQKIQTEQSKKYEMIGDSSEVIKLRSFIGQMRGHNTPVLILGESGTGKELIARGLYSQESNVCDRPFVAINCSALPENLIESILFGHEKGSFTGAINRQDGKFLAADGGDIFLDEIGDLPLTAQAKILRVLQEKEITRVGGNNNIPVNVRVIAATHKDLKAAVVNGTFREDLYYRLAVMTVTSSPLRERKGDIPVLAEHFLNDFRTSLKLSGEATEALIKHSWPGNIRALRNCIERAIILAKVDDSSTIELRHIQLDNVELYRKELEAETKDQPKGIAVPSELLPTSASQLNKDSLHNFRNWADILFYTTALELAGGNKRKLADILEVPRSSLYVKLKSIGVGIVQ